MWLSGKEPDCYPWIPGLTQWVWLCYRLAATAPIRPLAWELLYATGAAIERQKKKRKKERKRKEKSNWAK